MKQNEITQRFCRNCATILTDTDICCPQCGFAVGTGMRFCPYCGDPAAVGATTCTTCCQPLTDTAGTPIQKTAAPTMPEANVAYAPPPVRQQPVHPQTAPPPVQYVPNHQQGGYAYRNGAMPQYTVGYNTYTANDQKSKITGGILGIFLGVFGVHNFYLGYTGKAVAQLLITLLSCFILSPVVEIWGLIEGIMILAGGISTDGKGIPLKD